MDSASRSDMQTLALPRKDVRICSTLCGRMDVGKQTRNESALPCAHNAGLLILMFAGVQLASMPVLRCGRKLRERGEYENGWMQISARSLSTYTSPQSPLAATFVGTRGDEMSMKETKMGVCVTNQCSWHSHARSSY